MQAQIAGCPCKLKGKHMLVTPQAVQRPAFQTRLRNRVQASVTPTPGPFPGGNPVCPQGSSGLRVEPPVGGTYQLCSGLSITFTSANGKTVNWTATGQGIKNIIVKGGNAQNTYAYSGTVTSDTGLVSPLNNGGQVPDISHIDICFTCPGGQTQCPPGSVPDCMGVCNGPAVKDCNGVCNGPSIKDCAGTCYNPTTTSPPHIPDCKGICYDATHPPANSPDCKGVCGGTATKDCKGVCDGQSFQDCSKTCITPCDPLVSSFARQMGVKSANKKMTYGIRRR